MCGCGGVRLTHACETLLYQDSLIYFLRAFMHHAYRIHYLHQYCMPHLIIHHTMLVYANSPPRMA